jgi:BNR repeat-like domain
VAGRLKQRMLIGAALVLIGTGSLVVSFAADDEEGDPRIVVPASPVNEDARDLRDISANNSPTLAENPTDPDNLALANRIDESPFGCALHVSFDGGVRWRPAWIPFARAAPRECFAPDVAFGADGELYFSYVTLEGPGNVPDATWVASSDDGGRNLSAPRPALGPLSFQVRLAAAPERAGRIYLTYLKAAEVGVFQFSETGNPIEIVRSDDGGRTWSNAVRVSDPERERVVAGTPGIGPDGELLVLYLDLQGDRLDYHGAHAGEGGPPYDGSWQLVLARSDEDGSTWEQSVIEEELVPTERFIAFIPPFPSLAIDRRDGRLYAAFQDARLGDPDVFAWSSEDGGTSWSDPVRVNDTPEEDGSAQYRPQLAVAPDGRLDVVYYDRRDDDRDVRTEVALQSSSDGGESFGSSTTLSDRPFDSRIGFGFERNLADLGSRLGLLSADQRALAVWADTRGGTPNFPKQDLARAIVALPEIDDGISSAVRQLFRWGGVLLSGVGLGLLAGPRLASVRHRALAKNE